MKIRLFVSILIICVTAALALTQRNFDDVEIKAMAVAGSVHLLEGAGGNIGVSVGEDGVVMVDNQFAPLAEKIQAAIEKLGSGKPKFILNTHHHGDHTGGNGVFGADGTIIAHENVRRRLSEQPKEFWPVITFEQSTTLHFNNDEIMIRHLPNGHTDGDAVIFFKNANVIHMGDLFFAGRFPYVDLGSGGTVGGYMANVESVLDRIDENTKIIPGHGQLATKSDLEAFRNMLVETTTLVNAKIKNAAALADIQKEGLPEKWQSWGSGFINQDRWIEAIFNSYSREMSSK